MADEVKKVPVVGLDGEVVENDETGNPIFKDTQEEKDWIAGLDESDRKAYLAREAAAGRTIVPDAAEEAAEPEAKVPVRDLDGNVVEDDETGNPIFQGTDAEKAWIAGLDEDERKAYLDREAAEGRSIVLDGAEAPEAPKDAKVPVKDLEGDLVYDDETGNVVFQDTDAERKWISSLEIEQRECYLKRERDAGRTIEGEFEPVGSADKPADPPRGAGSMRENMRRYDEVTRESELSEGYVCWSENKGKTYKYDGPLGKFEFDPTQFALTVIHTPDDEHGAANECMALRYVGKEKNGNKIQVPDGVIDASYMFSGTDIERAPRLPDSVEMAERMFMSCPKLKDASATLPMNLKDGMFMFADCKNMEKGPSHLPDAMKYANGMFADDVKLRKPPTIGKNMEAMDYAFAHCMNMQSAPKIPSGASFSAERMCDGCTELDRKGMDKEIKQYQADRNQAQKKAESVGFFGKLASMCSAMAQFHAARQRGANMFEAARSVHRGREAGTLGKNWADVRASMTKNPTKRAKYRQQSIEKDRERAARIKAMMEKWDMTHVVGSTFTKDLERIAADGAEDFRNGFFSKIQAMDSTTRIGLQYTKYGRDGIYSDMTRRFKEEWDATSPSHDAKKGMVDFFIDRASENVAYYRQAQESINAGCKGEMRKEQLIGLRTATEMMNGPLIENVRELQEQYGLFTEKDKNRLNKLMENMGYKEDVFEGIGASVQETVAAQRDVTFERLDPAVVSEGRTHGPERAREGRQDTPEETGRKPEQPARDEPADGRQAGDGGAERTDTPADGTDIKDKVIEIGGAAVEAGVNAAKKAGSAAVALLGQMRALAAAAAESRQARKADEPATVLEAEEQEKKDKQGAQIGRGGGTDVADAREQVKVDEAVLQSQATETAIEANREALARREADLARREAELAKREAALNRSFGDIVQKGDEGKETGPSGPGT